MEKGAWETKAQVTLLKRMLLHDHIVDSYLKLDVYQG